MNVHHLELFYYVARNGGISAAVRKIPYGIQQPAVSTQVGRLEKELGVRLFERSPFRLTEPGKILYAHVAPFFDQMPVVATKLLASAETQLRIGAAELILRDHLPAIIQDVRKRFPRLKYSLRGLGFLAEAEKWLIEKELDVAFLPLQAKPPAKLNQLPMARLPLVLQVHPKSHYKTADDIFKKKEISLPLIGLEEASSVSRNFQRELRSRGIKWPQTVEVTSLDLIQRYVANGDGIGLGVLVDSKKKSRGVRLIPLDFQPITLGALWHGTLSAAAQATIEGVRAYAKRMWPEAAL